MNKKLKFTHIVPCVILIILTNSPSLAQQLQVYYNPSQNKPGRDKVVDLTGNGYDGTLLGGAKISTFENIPVIDLGDSEGYVDMGAKIGEVIEKLHDFTIHTKVFIPSTTNLNQAGNFVWTFSNSDNTAKDANGCLFFSARKTKYAISPSSWRNESLVQTGPPFDQGAWKYITYVQTKGTGYLYVDGFLIKSDNIKLSPSALGATPHNYLGRSCYVGDAYLKGAKYAEFRIYHGALTVPEIEKLTKLKKYSGKVKLISEFDFSTDRDKTSNYTGTLNNGAKTIQYAGQSVLSVGEENGYFEFGEEFGKITGTLDSFSISVNMMVPESTNLDGNGNFIWTFANSTDMSADANGGMFYSAKNNRYAISKSNYSAESMVKANSPLPKGKWINLTYTQQGERGFIYIDGHLDASGITPLKPKDLGMTSYNFLGRSCYAGDLYLKNALYSNFRIYQGAIGEQEIMKVMSGLAPLNRHADSLAVIQAANTLDIQNKKLVDSKIALPRRLTGGIEVSWASSNKAAVMPDGTVFRPNYGEKPASVTLTATLTRHSYTAKKTLEVTVLPSYSDEESVESDLSKLSIKGITSNARSQLTLSHQASEGSRITWVSKSPDFINHSGRVIKLSPKGKGKKKVILTATASKGTVTKSKDFTVYAAEEEDRAAYLFSYFTGNSQNQEQIRFAISYDGLHYTPLNNGKPIINSSDIALKKAVRDPHILRGHDGKTFYMVVTDMKSSEGWSSNRGMVLLKSTDLVNWTHSAIHFPTRWPDKWKNVIRVWAPQTIYDPQAGKYMVYFSLLTNDGKCPYDKIYYCYANEDFTDLEGEPRFFFDRGSATIDGDIVYSEADSLYHLFFKNESISGISKVTASSLTPAKGQPDGSQWSTPLDNMEQTNEAVEGAGVFRLINSDQWVLMYDCYSNGHYQFCKSSDLESFHFVMDNYSMDARHGTTISITEDEAKRLVKAFPSTSLTKLSIHSYSPVIKEDGMQIDETSKKITLPVYNGTDLTDFNPLFTASPGTKISPKGCQDFSNGSIPYTFAFNKETVNYQVGPIIQANPIIPDFHADPEILYAEKTGLFYCYPTTDGFPGWGGYSFDVFSSPDLVNWTNEGTFLDLSTDQVSWASGNAWAPCIEEKKISENNYKYYFYFSGNAGDRKKIGVAVSDNPTGPFVDSGAPMIGDLPKGARGQNIDGDVFTDPKSGKSYFYWGNGFMAVAELNADMMSINEETTRIITPQGGTLDTYAFREGAYVFYRNGTYYFLWSVDDTGSPNYHVAYGTSDSPMGPIKIAKNPIVTGQDADQAIYGPAHNSVLQIPGTDDWYIVYHRINANYLKNSPGTHREVCIDKLEFNEDGSIRQVTPTKRGIDPVFLK